MTLQLVRLLSLLAAVGSATPILLYIFSSRFRALTCPPDQKPQPNEEPRTPKSMAWYSNTLLDKLTGVATVALSLIAGWLIADHYSLHPVNALILGLALAALLKYLRGGL